MKKANALKILNPVIGLLILNQLTTGILREHLPEETFEHLHIPGAILLIIGTIVHLALNWSWIKAMYFKKKAAPKA